MKRYIVVYKEYEGARDEEIEVMAENSASAYMQVQDKFNWTLWGAYVESYIKKDNSKHYFKNMFGYPY